MYTRGDFMFLVLYSNYKGVRFYKVIKDFFELRKFIKDDFLIDAIYFCRDLPPNYVDIFV